MVLSIFIIGTTVYNVVTLATVEEKEKRLGTAGVAGKGPCLGGRRGVPLGVAWNPPSPHGSVTSFPQMPICFLAGSAILPM